MRICLLTGGGYPYRRDALGGWCRTLVSGLPQHTFDLLTLTDQEPPAQPTYTLPAHVSSATAVHFTAAPRRRICSPDEASAAAVMLSHGALSPEPHADDMVAEGLRRLAALAMADEAPLAGVPLSEFLLDAWRAARDSHRGGGLTLPPITLRDARTAAALLRHATRALAVRAPEVDVLHCVGGTTPLLTALAARWRTGTALLLTEARPPISRARGIEERLSPVVRTVLRRFRRAVARIGYAEAGLIAPLSAYHHTWALRHGAPPTKLVAVPAGVDPRLHPALTEPTGEPVIVATGTGEMSHGLPVLLDAAATVIAAVAGTRWHLAGTVAAHRAATASAIDAARLGWAVREFGAATPVRYAAGHVIVHLPSPTDPPYRLAEAMLSGRPVIALDVGPAAETLGDAGVLVRAGDPAALAAACIALLRSPARRRALGAAGRRRALTHFTADRVLKSYDALYTDLVTPPSPLAHELALAVPAPRPEWADRPWFCQEER